MTGPKLNDGVMLLDGQVSTRATARFVRGSATKARAVLDLIRGLDVSRADEVLRLTERAAAADVRKVLASAVANAVHNDEQDPEELFVLACYADDGPTLKRFRARARGRASRINKRTCHITVIVARMSDERLELTQAREAAGAARPGTSAAARRERVARSRARAEALKSGTEETAEDRVEDVPEEATEAGVEPAAEMEAEPEGDASTVKSGALEAPDGASGSVEASRDDDATAEAGAPADALDLPAGAVAAPEDGSIPPAYPIKGNTNSMKYHEPGSRYYDVTIAELYFDTPESAEAAGYEAPGGSKSKTSNASTEHEASTEPEAPSGASRATDETEND